MVLRMYLMGLVPLDTTLPAVLHLDSLTEMPMPYE